MYFAGEEIVQSPGPLHASCRKNNCAAWVLVDGHVVVANFSPCIDWGLGQNDNVGRTVWRASIGFVTAKANQQISVP